MSFDSMANIWERWKKYTRPHIRELTHKIKVTDKGRFYKLIGDKRIIRADYIIQKNKSPVYWVIPTG